MLAYLLVGTGAVLVVGGVVLLSVPVAVILTGVALLGLGLLMDSGKDDE